VPTAYFTHISHQLGRHQDVEARLPQGIHLGYDGLTLQGKMGDNSNNDYLEKFSFKAFPLGTQHYLRND